MFNPRHLREGLGAMGLLEEYRNITDSGLGGFKLALSPSLSLSLPQTFAITQNISLLPFLQSGFQYRLQTMLKTFYLFVNLKTSCKFQEIDFNQPHTGQMDSTYI